VKKAFFKAGVSTNVPRVQSATEDLQEDTNDLPQEETNNLDDLDDCPLFQRPGVYASYDDDDLSLSLSLSLSLCVCLGLSVGRNEE